MHGFKTKERTFGFIMGYPVKLNRVNAAIVVPARTIYQKDTIKIISTRDLRKTLKLEDGDEVVVE
jgi:riboflavin kinase